MASSDEELTVAQRLGRALDRGLLPAGGPAEAAERLIERLERPARIALLGLPGSGKSSILNLLVGAVVVPEMLRLPTIVVQYGETARMMCTLTDGSTKILPGSNLADVLPLAPALVTLEMDLAALKVISLLEVSAGHRDLVHHVVSAERAGGVGKPAGFGQGQQLHVPDQGRPSGQPAVGVRDA
jgi:hypothetical protein